MRKKNITKPGKATPKTGTPESEALALQLKAIGSRMKMVRKASNLTQAKISEKFGYSLRTYQKNEAGISEGGILLVYSFAGVGVDANWLLTGEGEMKRSPAGLHVREDLTEYQERHGNALTPGQMDLMRATLEAVEEGLATTTAVMTPEKKSEIILTVYELLNRDPTARDAVLKLVRLAV